jgi:hypothetical protein
MIDWYATYIPNRHAQENPFCAMTPRTVNLPKLEDVRALLPAPIWSGHNAALEAYWKVWEIAFRNLHNPSPENHFVSPYMDTGFNGNLFMWDSAFITLFARYAKRAFDFQGTLDNFYAKQHPDGFICREIRESDGTDCFKRFDPAATGPEVLPWAEWEYFLNFADLERLGRVYPALMAYHTWMRNYRTWPNGTYWATGWASGMDNQPRLSAHRFAPAGDGPLEWWSHDHMTWVDTCFQAVVSARALANMAQQLGRHNEANDLRTELEALLETVNAILWDESSAFYVDRYRDGRRSRVKTIGAYWALLSAGIPAQRLEAFVAHLDDPTQFKRQHRVPTLSADHPEFNPRGGYWRGSVWSPTNYMVLRGLSANGFDRLAHEIALNHHSAVMQVFQSTGTLWENYAPDTLEPGSTSAPEFVGWTGLTPTAILFEYVFGMRPDVPQQRLVWDLRLLEEHGVNRYPFGMDGLLDLHCAARSDRNEKPIITVSANISLTLELRWGDSSKTLLPINTA